MPKTMMTVEKTDELQQVLKQLAFDTHLLRDESSVKGLKETFEDLYMEGDRHSYSAIFETIAQIQRDSSEKANNLETLTTNLRDFAELYKSFPSADKTVVSSIDKLVDHVNLDVARINYTENTYFNSIKHTIASNESAFGEKINNLQEKIENAQNQLADAQKSNITILSIFSSVVLACIAGITFSSSAFSCINQTNIYRLLLVSLIVGFVVVNIFFALFYYLQEIAKSIKAPKLKTFWVVNLLFLLVIVVVCIAWYHGWVENRNLRFCNTNYCFWSILYLLCGYCIV